MVGSGRRRWAMAVFALTALGVVVAVAPTSTAAAGGAPPQVLERDMRGEAAINALGDRLPAVAAQNGLTPAAFRSALRADEMLWVGRTGQLLFVDDFAGPHGDEAGIAHDLLDGGTVPGPAEIFTLHSRPGASRTIALDFDGHDARGTAWGNTDAQIAGPYDSDGSPTTYSDVERAQIFGIWQRVAEDYAPFDIDVTTADPGYAAINRASESDGVYGTRVVVTPSKPYNCNCGGVAYVGVYDSAGTTHDHYQPGWVFTAGVGTGAKNIAEAASHEAGHNLGLSHDGTKRTGYYQGHGDWAPIMGVGYSRPITQWSRGEYSGADNTEDDLAVIQSNGGPLAPDDWTGVAPLTSPVTGVIGTRGDTDSFALSLGAASRVVLDVAAAPVSPNLDIQVRVLDGAGATVASADPSSDGSSGSDTSTGLGAVLDATLPAGEYVVVVDGVGWGSASTTGYSDYGSLGRYRLTATVTPGGTGGGGGTTVVTSPPAAPSGVVASAVGGTVTVRWDDNSAGASQETGFEVVRQFLHRNGSWRGATTVGTTATDVAAFTETPGSGTFRYAVRAVNALGASSSSAYSGGITVPNA